MLKRILFTLLIAALLTYVLKITKNIPEDIMESVVVVESSSGVVVYSNKNFALVLTCYHVIDKAIQEERDITVIFLYKTDDGIYYETYDVKDMQINQEKDLALLEIQPSRILRYSKITKYSEYPNLGEDIFIGSNPNHKYRSLKKGIVSSKQRYLDNILTWELSGGIVFGSSGGGAFTVDGKLFGIVRAVEPLLVGCWDEAGEEEKFADNCLLVPIYHMGYVISPEEVTSFLLSDRYSEYFDYLR